MDTYSSGEDLVAKTRKPYTITKQRERWTDEEHNRFLEALKLYGRAWQRIEEHIGTKTAVQIRSHAQKFFSKLEKEALVKGIPIGQAIDIEIPPPRPKRKPNNPYPRKNGAVIASTTLVGVKDGKLETSPGKQVVDLEKEAIPERCNVDGGAGNDVCSEFPMYEETPPTNTIPSSKADTCNFTEFIPVVQKDKSSESRLSDGVVAMDVVQNNGTENEMQGGKNFPRHAPVHILDGSGSQAISSSDVSFQETAYQQQMAAAAAAGTSRFEPPFHPFGGTREEYGSVLEASSAFSSLIVSTLVQNPAAHAAAIFAAASFWPPTTNTEAMNPTPGMAAIAAATIAAATAWWAAHGLLPAYHHAGFTCPSATATHHPAPMDIQNCSTQQQPQQQLDSIQNSELKSPTTTSSSDSGQHDHDDNNNNNPAAAAAAAKDSNKNKNVKLVDRSSCGSNSSSETDVLEKHEEDKEEADEGAGEFSIRRTKNSSSFNESWKEVSEVGRMAFKALFLREILPQSFSPPQDMKIENQNRQKKNEQGTSLDLKSNIRESCSSRHGRMADEEEAEQQQEEEGLLTIGLSQQVKSKTRRTGFKPYKRCSIEAAAGETRIMPNSATTQDQDKCPKRLRLGDPPLS